MVKTSNNGSLLNQSYHCNYNFNAMAQFYRYITEMPRFLSVRNALSLAMKIS
jgi:hypothetical protein